ncbi:histone-lysine N-methyltransferase, H3 lysine-79 specific isoform X2 [Cydia pomonella]|uniref:histone-lysine N-methyltransferase, H3 lysine-79 specific isoform X2 n=1 Tax=Cydia pomonella TaxID=82600 RepID=UPI002ADD7895|nr:histone-lysine N-methyltransferase, H3 lysine-79 specific isoform X2 [Cydia pomonella]
MFTSHSQRLRRRLSAPTSGSARRRARERRQAQLTRVEGERLAQERKERVKREKLEQQRQARAELASYEPWGRAGGGAPNARSLRRTDLRVWGIYPEDELKGVALYEACRRWSGRRRRRRMPLRLREDPQVCYAENLRRAVDNDIRYRQTPDQQQTYRRILDDMVDTRKRAIKAEMKKNLEYERKMQTMDGPWGKPGPGGTVWRNPRDVGLNFSKSMGWTDNDLLNKLQSDEHKRYKRSSLTLPNVKRDDDTKDRNTPDKENKSQSELKLPDINHTNSPKSKNQEVQKEESTQTSNGQVVKKDDGVSTVTSKDKLKKKKFVKRLPNGEKINRTLPEEEHVEKIEKENATDVGEKKLTPEETILRATGGIELVPILARRRRVGARTLHSSDVTRPPEDMCQWRELLNEDYLRELKHQIKAKYQRKEEARQNSAESVRQHQETWASLWGRPGHGAPQQRGRYARNNLARLLNVGPLTNTFT